MKFDKKFLTFKYINFILTDMFGFKFFKTAHNLQASMINPLKFDGHAWTKIHQYEKVKNGKKTIVTVVTEWDDVVQIQNGSTTVDVEKNYKSFEKLIKFVKKI